MTIFKTRGGGNYVQYSRPVDGSAVDHGTLAGLAGDDHTQYHNDARGDARYYTETELDAGQLDNRYYTETEIDNRVLNDLSDVSAAAPNTNDVLEWNGSAWAPVAPGGGASALDDLTDVTLTTPTTGAVLYKSAGDWIDTDAILIDPADSVDLRFNGSLAARTSITGLDVVDTSGNDAFVAWYQDDGTTQTGFMVFQPSSNRMLIRNNSPADTLQFEGRNTGDTANHLCLELDPDGAVSLYFNNTLEAVTKSSGFRVVNELEVDGDINHDGTNVGFYGTAPVAQSAAYTPTNVTTDRAYDANSTTLDEVADVLGTLIADLQATGLIG